ncbi:MAG: polysaccharide deacetylase family protein, partial [Chloroflexi bacterium]|nr:polysaccharide deacetylase family protein [Chloroflexota bacterium]
MDRSLISAVLALALLVTPRAVPARAHSAAADHDSAFVPVVIFHHIKWLTPADDAMERGLTVLPSQFQAELAYLARAHYHTIGAAQLVRYLRLGGSLPPKPVVLTFDDGYRDVYPNAYRLLRQQHMTATFFIVPGFLNTPRYLTWTQVEDMSAHGMDIESHTMTHPDLTTLSPSRRWYELTESRRELESRLHRSIRVFAYPYGAFAGLTGEVAKAGYWGAFTTQAGWWQRRSDLLTLPRVYSHLTDTVASFA